MQQQHFSGKVALLGALFLTVATLTLTCPSPAAAQGLGLGLRHGAHPFTYKTSFTSTSTPIDANGDGIPAGAAHSIAVLIFNGSIPLHFDNYGIGEGGAAVGFNTAHCPNLTEYPLVYNRGVFTPLHGNPDQLFWSYTSGFSCCDAKGFCTATGTASFVGGTGVFAGATGTFTSTTPTFIEAYDPLNRAQSRVGASQGKGTLILP